jgi:DNA (cytosine-5)-methyltransferase 1
MKYTPTANSYFSGAGGLDIGIMEAGVKILQSMDLDPKATSAMEMNKHYFGHEVITGDISLMTVLDQPKSDIMLFTYPCTKYSAIADIHGTRTGDELFLHSLRHIALMQPEMYVVENVPGMKKFKIVMETMTKLPDYYITVFCPVQATNWLPQRRDRLIVIATRKPFTVGQPEAVKVPRLKDLLETDPKIHIPDCLVARLSGKYRDKPIIVDPELPGAVAPTCVAHYMKDLGTRVVKDKNSPVGVRPFTIREYARLQGFPDDYKFRDEVYSYRLIGNAVAIPMGRWIGEQAIKYFN